jgi:hypothetical protein
MPIRWSALKVSEAADMIAKVIEEAAEPLERIRIIAREARKLPNLPQYMDWEFSRIIGEVDRVVGGSQWESVGRLRAGVEGIRKNLPAGAVEAETNGAKHGKTESLI